MTERLYYRDSYLTEFRARVVDTSPDGKRVYLDRTAFYPTSGGQPFDMGALGGVRVAEVVEEGERIAHVVEAPVGEVEVDARIDRDRRFDHMQQHTGQHLLSAVFIELLNAPTVSFHLGEASCTIDIERVSLPAAEIQAVEKRANEIVFENRPVSISFEDASADLGLRKPTEREGEIRIVSIAELDRSACGGTHVRATGEIGPILIRRLDRIRGQMRVEFVCGMRAVREARRDYDTVAAVSRALSCPAEEAAALVAGQAERLHAAEKARARMAVELARVEGQRLFASTEAGPSGRRVATRTAPAFNDEFRALAQSFAAGESACFVGIAENPPGLLLAASAASGIHAGNLLKEILSKHGGRGGGNAGLAQGSVPSPESLSAALAELEREI